MRAQVLLTLESTINLDDVEFNANANAEALRLNALIEDFNDTVKTGATKGSFRLIGDIIFSIKGE